MLAILAVVLLGLIILAFFRWKPALLVVIGVALWLLIPVGWMHLTHAVETARSPYDHVRYLSERATSDPEGMAGYAATIGPNAQFQRCYIGWTKNPAHCQWFEIHDARFPNPITFRIFALGDVGFPSTTLLEN